MSRDFPNVQQNDFIDEGLLDLLKRDLAVLTTFSGEGVPDDGPDGVFYNDLLNKQIATKDEKIIDYKVGTPNSGTLERSYQPLHQELTLFSSIIPTNNSVISFKTALSITTFFCSLNLNNVDTFKSAFKFGELAYKNKISVTDIADQSVGVEKFEEGLITEPPFKTGDIVFSLSNTKTGGWIRLDDSLTIGSFISGAAYNGNDYKNLYLLMWTHPDSSVQTMYGGAAEKGASATDDWENNKRLKLPSKHSLFQTRPGDVVLEANEPVEKELFLRKGVYEITLVGGAGGGAGCGKGGGSNVGGNTANAIGGG